MRLKKFFIILLLCTLSAILYVRQQVESTKLGYEINAQETALDDMLDQRQMLLYNGYNLKSPENLQQSFTKKSKKQDEFKIVNNKQIVVLSGVKETKSKNLFGITSLAEAKTQD